MTKLFEKPRYIILKIIFKANNPFNKSNNKYNKTPI